MGSWVSNLPQWWIGVFAQVSEMLIAQWGRMLNFLDLRRDIDVDKLLLRIKLHPCLRGPA